MNITTKRYPRTLEQAFGPYTSHQFVEQDPMPAGDKIVVGGCLAAGLAVVVMAIVGWI